MKEYKKQYRPICQLPYCCVPATLQWILYRRKLDIYDQILIGSELGLRVPERFFKYFNNENIKELSCRAKEYGTQILKEEYSIKRFFSKYNIPLSISEEFHFENIYDLEIFLIEKIKEGDIDIVIRFNNGIFNKENGIGHFGLVISVQDGIVIIGDPEPPFFKNVKLEELLFSISDKIDGVKRGLYLITGKKMNISSEIFNVGRCYVLCSELLIGRK